MVSVRHNAIYLVPFYFRIVNLCIMIVYYTDTVAESNQEHDFCLMNFKL